MFMKRFTGIVLVLILVLSRGIALASDFLVVEQEPSHTAAGAIQAGGPLAAAYEAACRMAESGDLITSINTFAKMGKYQDAPLYTAYLEAKLHLLRNDPAKAAGGFSKLGDFLDSAALAAKAQALFCHRFQQEDLFGYVSGNGQVIIEAQFDWAERSFRPESVWLSDKDREALPVAAVFMGSTFCDGTNLLPQEGKYGLLRRDGKLVAPIAYDEILWTADGIGALRTGQVFTLMYLQTGESLGGEYEDIGAYAEGFVPVKSYGKWGYLSREGRMLPGDFAWDSALPFREGMAGVSQDKRAGFINTDGQVTIPLTYDDVHSFGGGLAGVKQGKKWGFINTQGELVIKPAYSQVGIFAMERCPAKRGDKWGVINGQGEWVISNKYDEITEFDPIYHRAWMRNNKLWGLLSLDSVVLKPSWATFTPFAADGISAVSYKGLYGYIDTRGVNRIPSGFDMASAFSAGLGGVSAGEGAVQYLNKLGRGFSVMSDVPTQPLNGFIEGRIITENPIIQAETDTGLETRKITYSISFVLYDLEGNPMEFQV